MTALQVGPRGGSSCGSGIRQMTSIRSRRTRRALTRTAGIWPASRRRARFLQEGMHQWRGVAVEPIVRRTALRGYRSAGAPAGSRGSYNSPAPWRADRQNAATAGAYCRFPGNSMAIIRFSRTGWRNAMISCSSCVSAVWSASIYPQAGQVSWTVGLQRQQPGQ